MLTARKFRILQAEIKSVGIGTNKNVLPNLDYPYLVENVWISPLASALLFTMCLFYCHTKIHINTDKRMNNAKAVSQKKLFSLKEFINVKTWFHAQNISIGKRFWILKSFLLSFPCLLHLQLENNIVLDYPQSPAEPERIPSRGKKLFFLAPKSGQKT